MNKKPRCVAKTATGGECGHVEDNPIHWSECYQDKHPFQRHRMNKDTEEFLTKARAIVREIAQNRDKLREVMEEYEEILDDSDSAVLDMEAALDTLSQHL